jgi:hypothetical protein
MKTQERLVDSPIGFEHNHCKAKSHYGHSNLCISGRDLLDDRPGTRSYRDTRKGIRFFQILEYYLLRDALMAGLAGRRWSPEELFHAHGTLVTYNPKRVGNCRSKELQNTENSSVP